MPAIIRATALWNLAVHYFAIPFFVIAGLVIGYFVYLALNRNNAPVVDAMLPRLFGKMTREYRPERVEPMKDVMSRTSPQGIAGALRGMAARPDRRADLPKIMVPTLVLVGDEDVITPPAEAKSMADALPNARLEVISQAGHLSPYENPSDANAAILRFLKSLEN